MDTLQQFSYRVRYEWLPSYCADARRSYSPDGFKLKSISVSEADARDCMLAIDHKIVQDAGGGRYRARRSSAQEVLFWEGEKSKSPRPISLWLEPVITFAALARLHLRYQWPKESLGAQPLGWAFDVAAYISESNQSPVILGEVKKSRTELIRLRDDLVALSKGASLGVTSNNSIKKWRALIATKPKVLWLVGPAEEEYIYAPSYAAEGAMLHEVSQCALKYDAA